MSEMEQVVVATSRRHGKQFDRRFYLTMEQALKFTPPPHAGLASKGYTVEYDVFSGPPERVEP